MQPGTGLNLTFLMKKLSIVLFIFSHHPRLHPLCLSDGPRLLTSLCLTAAHAFSNVHTCTGISGPRPIRGGVRPSLSLIGLDHDMGLMCVCCWTTGRLSESRRPFFSPLERLVAPVRPQIFLVAPLRNWSHSRALQGGIFFVINSFLFLFFSHITQHNIQNITKQNNISRSNQKGGREGRTIKTQKSLLYTITYIHQTLQGVFKALKSFKYVKWCKKSLNCNFKRSYSWGWRGKNRDMAGLNFKRQLCHIINMSDARFKVKIWHGCLYVNVSLKGTDCPQKRIFGIFI